MVIDDFLINTTYTNFELVFRQDILTILFSFFLDFQHLNSMYRLKTL